jgi:hypothetical protein
MGFLRLDFVKLTGHALNPDFGARDLEPWACIAIEMDAGRSGGGKFGNVPSVPEFPLLSSVPGSLRMG